MCVCVCVSHSSGLYRCNIIFDGGPLAVFEIIITQVCVVVEGRYLVEVRLNGYSNPIGKCDHAFLSN